MKPQHKNEDPWQYGTYDGAERLQFQQTARMTLSERLQALDEMIQLVSSIHGPQMLVREDSTGYGTIAKKK
jgi:hypothetical protein